MSDQEEAAEFCAKYLPESDEVYRALVGASKHEIRELTRVLNESSVYSTNRVRDVLLDIITRFRVQHYLMSMNTSVLPPLDSPVGSSSEPLREEQNK